MGKTDKNLREIIDKSYDAGRDATIDKAVAWLKDNWREYIFHDADGMIGFIGWEKDFRKAMKKEYGYEKHINRARE